MCPFYGAYYGFFRRVRQSILLIRMVIYVLAAAAASVMFSNVLANLNILTWHYSKIFIPSLIYLSWFAASTWAFKRLNKQHP